jgi:hypothetical protein
VRRNAGEKAMKKSTKEKILKCGAVKEQKEHPWATPTIALRIATDHGVKDYPDCKMTVRDNRKF